MDSRSLNVLHDAGDEDVLAVADGIHFDLLTHDVFVNQDGMLLSDLVDDADEFVDVLVVYGNLHSLAAQHVGGAH